MAGAGNLQTANTQGSTSQVNSNPNMFAVSQDWGNTLRQGMPQPQPLFGYDRPQPQPMTPSPRMVGGQYGQGDINTASAGAISGAMAGTGGAMGYRPRDVQAGQLATTDLQQYQNPYTQQVIDASAQDVLRNAQLGLNQLSGQAQRAGAFGGSRHGVAMGEIGRGVAQQLGQQSAQLRQAGFQNAQQMAQTDIANRMQSDLANQQAGLQGAQFRLGAANQLGQLGNLGFGIGQQINQNMMNQGNLLYGLNQQIIDAAKGQYAGYTGAPASSIGYLSSALGATPTPTTTTTSQQPGLFNYLALAAMSGK